MHETGYDTISFEETRNPTAEDCHSDLALRRVAQIEAIIGRLTESASPQDREPVLTWLLRDLERQRAAAGPPPVSPLPPAQSPMLVLLERMRGLKRRLTTRVIA